MGPTWGPSGADRTQVGSMWAPWNLLSGMLYCQLDSQEQISMKSLANVRHFYSRKCVWKYVKRQPFCFGLNELTWFRFAWTHNVPNALPACCWHRYRFQAVTQWCTDMIVTSYTLLWRNWYSTSMSRAKECRGSGRLSSNVAPPFSGFDITDISSSVLVSTITGGLVLIIIEGDYQEHLRLCWFLEIGRICPYPHTVFAHPSAVTVRPLRRWRCTLSCTQLAATSREVLGLISLTVFRRLIDIRRRVGSNIPTKSCYEHS